MGPQQKRGEERTNSSQDASSVSVGLRGTSIGSEPGMEMVRTPLDSSMMGEIMTSCTKGNEEEEETRRRV